MYYEVASMTPPAKFSQLPIIVLLLFIFIFHDAISHKNIKEQLTEKKDIHELNIEDLSAAEFAAVCTQFPALPECISAKVNKRKSAYMRFGRSASISKNGINDLYGKDIPQAMEKRKSAYMRFGKRKSAYMRFGKRSQLSDINENLLEMEKRKSAYMRFGKK